MNVKSIRFKLVLWYMLMLAVTLSFFSILLYHIFSNSLTGSADVLLRSRAEGIANSIDTYWETEKLEAIKDGVDVENFSKIDNINFAKIAQRWVEEKSDDPQLIGTIVQIYGADGKRITYSKNIPSISILSKKAFNYVLRGKSRFGNIDIDLPPNKEVDLRTFTMPVFENNKVAYIIQVARPLSVIKSAQDDLRTLLLFLLPLTVLLTGVVGLFLAKLALSPVDRIIETIHQITVENLRLRINIPDTKDEIKRLADTFNDMLGRLERSFTTQKQFIEDLSHELKTPLAVLKGEMEVTLKKIRSTQEYESALTSGLDEINTIIRIVENLLMLARFDSDTIALEMRPLNITDVILGAINDIKVLAEAKNITLASPAALAGGVGLIKGEEGQIRRLFLNLLDNAVKYTPRGGRVTINAGEEKNFVKVEVSDTGVGVPPEELPHIFDRFYRVDKSRGSAGFGLGLSISKSIVEAHKGRIEAKSEPGRGTTLTVFLPKA